MTTVDTALAGKRILIAEDEYVIAKCLVRDLQNAGADVLGPAMTVDEALDLAETMSLDGAILDIKLRGEMAYAVIDLLTKRGVPFVLATGYSSDDALPDRFRSVPKLLKPFSTEGFEAALRNLLKTP